MHDSIPETTETKGPNAASRSHFERESCLARSIICLDQEAFRAQIKAEEEMERRMSMVRKNVPLPAPPSNPPEKNPSPAPSPRKKGNQVFKLNSTRCQESIENFMVQVNLFILHFVEFVFKVLMYKKKGKRFSYESRMGGHNGVTAGPSKENSS